MKLVLRVIATAVAVAVAAFVVPGVSVQGPTPSARLLTLIVVAAVIGLINAFVKPLVVGLSSCLILLTFGLFLLVVNALMLMLAAWVAQSLGFGFFVSGFWAALIASLIVSLVSGIMNGLLGTDRREA
nr:phage holin family protein [Propionibacterium sp.]